MTPTREETEKILQQIFGLEEISDKELLRTMINQKIDSMSKVERLTFDMKVGQKIKQLESPKEGVPPTSNTSKVLTIVMFGALAILGIWLPLKYHWHMALKIPIFLFSAIWAISAIRAIYKLSTHRW